MTIRREKTSAFRKLSIYGFEMVNGGHTFYALLDFDVTDLRKKLRLGRSGGEGGSLFAFVLKAIGKCLEEFPEFNSMINEKRKTAFSEVDIDIPIEIHADGEIYNKQCIIRNINAKSLQEVDREIALARQVTGEELSYLTSRYGQRLFTLLPRSLVLFIFRRILRNHRMVRDYSGTVFVTSVSMFSNAQGYIIPYAGGPKAVSFAVGSVVKKPVVKNDQITAREIMNITGAFNHDLVDGAPAARLINRLRRYIEHDYAELM